MKSNIENGPKRAKYPCRPRAGRRDPPIGDGDIGELTANLRTAVVEDGVPDHMVKASACRFTREAILAHASGRLTVEQAAGSLTSGREVLEDGGYEEPQVVVVETLLLHHAHSDPENAERRSSAERLTALAERLQDRVYDAEKRGAVPPDLSWDAGLAWAACARVADLSRDADDALGYARLAIGLTWQDHPRAYAVCVEVLRRILFERGETVLATAMPRVVRTDLGQDPIRGHYALATTIWAV